MATIVNRGLAQSNGAYADVAGQKSDRSGRINGIMLAVKRLLARTASRPDRMTATLGATDDDLATLADRSTVERRLDRARAEARVLTFGGLRGVR